MGRIFGYIPEESLSNINLDDLDQIIFGGQDGQQSFDVRGPFYRFGDILISAPPPLVTPR
jgi:hypothetical protein